MNFESIKLSELTVDGRGRYGIAASAVEKSDDLYTYLRITDIYEDGTLNKAGLKSVDDPDAEKYLLKPNDIVFARTGNSTGKNYFYDERDGNFVYAGFLIKFSLDPKKVNPRFVKYYCQSQRYKNWVDSFNTGSTRGNINAQTYGDMEILTPSRAQQDFLVEILSALDDKIELNRRINANLEQQAAAIFDERFPGATKEIPVGWRRGCLLDVADYLNGLAMQRFRPAEGENGLPVLKIKELRQGTCDANSELCSSNIKPEYVIHDGDVIFSWSGTLLVDIWCGGDCGLNQHLFKVTSEKYDKWFYYLWTLRHLERFIAIAADKATTMGHIKRSELAKAEVLIPPPAEYLEIGAAIRPLYELLVARRVENRKLAELRDTLLPRLMSGEIDVSDVLL